MNNPSTRRSFLGTTATVAAAAWAGGRTYAAGASAQPGPNDTVNVGLIGCGGRGNYLLSRFQELPGVRIVAVADFNEPRLVATRKRAGGERVEAFHDYRKLLERKDIQAVIVATNKHWHALPAVNACQAGKDVYVEKPLAHSIGEGQAIVRAAEKYNRIVQTGTQQHSWEHYRQAVELIRAGELGEISEVKVWDYVNQYPGWGCPADCDPPAGLDWDFWLGPAPKKPYNPNYFLHDYWFFDYAGSFQCDWAAHHYDIVHWALGVDQPKTVVAMGGMMCFPKNNLEYPDTLDAILEYPAGPVAKQGFLMHYTFRGGCRREHRSHGKCFFGTKASLIIDRSGYTIVPEKAIDDKSKHVTVPATTGDTHAQGFLECVRTRKQPAANALVGHRATTPGHLINIAWRTGHKINWDAEKEEAQNDPQANALVHKPYRAPWKLDV
jgi:predicted dehydrogenase